MHLRYYTGADGKRVYTLKTILEDNSYTLNAHPGNLNNYLFEKLDLVPMIHILMKDMK